MSSQRTLATKQIGFWEGNLLLNAWPRIRSLGVSFAHYEADHNLPDALWHAALHLWRYEIAFRLVHKSGRAAPKYPTFEVEFVRN